MLKKLIYCRRLVAITVKLFHKDVLNRIGKIALKNSSTSADPTILGSMITRCYVRKCLFLCLKCKICVQYNLYVKI